MEKPPQRPKETHKTMVTFRVAARQVDRFQIEAVTGENTLIIDQPKAVGGNGAGPCPVEVVLAGFAACILNVAYVIAAERTIKLRGLAVLVEGDLNPAKFLGQITNDRPGFQSMRLIIHIDADLTLAEKEEFLSAVEARCPVFDNLTQATPVEILLEEKACG
jgi:uncharacterized OsmC-like protein